MLTGRHSGSFETQFEQDMRRIRELGAAEYLASIEQSQLGPGYWESGLPLNLITSSTRSPFFKVFLASQVKVGAKGFLSKHISVKDMLDGMGDIHHIFPRDYLTKSGVNDRSEVNQIANYVLAETAINIAISNRPPADYMALITEQVSTKKLRIGEIDEMTDVTTSLRQNAIPKSIFEMRVDDYAAFLEERRGLMARLIRDYYESL